MRQIDMLALKFRGFAKQMTYCSISSKQILMACSCICRKIYMRNVSLIIKTLHELKSIFHENVEQLLLHDDARIVFDLDENINDEDMKDEEFGMLDVLMCTFRGNSAKERDNKFTYDMINWFDRFSMRRFVTYYSLEWTPFFNVWRGAHATSILYESIDVFDQFLQEDYNGNHPLLETVLIKLRDRYDLSGFARLLIYFNNNYEKLFVEKLGLQNFQSILIQFEELQWDIPIGYQPNIKNCIPRARHPEIYNYNENELIFAQERNKIYSIDKKEITISNVEKGIQYFGTIYQNVVDWMKRIQENRDEYESLAGPIEGCKVVFAINKLE